MAHVLKSRPAPGKKNWGEFWGCPTGFLRGTTKICPEFFDVTIAACFFAFHMWVFPKKRWLKLPPSGSAGTAEV